jgi:hypothetical protein
VKPATLPFMTTADLRALVGIEVEVTIFPPRPHLKVLGFGSRGHMKRREFIRILGGTAVTWPLAARAQQRDGLRRVAILMTLAEDDTEGQRRVNAFLQGMQEFGWVRNRNIAYETRWGAGDIERGRTLAAEIVALAPDVILAPGSAPCRLSSYMFRTR